MLHHSPRLLRLPSLRVKPLIQAFRTHSSAVESRYADKIQQRLATQGFKNIEQYKKHTRPSTPHSQPVEPALVSPRPAAAPTKATSPLAGRKDSPPVLPLSDIMDLAKIMKTPHTAEQIGALWTAYHAAKSQSPTSRIYLSATIPTATYEQLLSKVPAYPSFVLPLPRPDALVDPAPDASDAGTTQGSPHEFYFMQWCVHGPPPTPSSDGLPPLFNQPSSSSQSAPNPSCTTVLFTSLQEYKLRQDYATPHLIITHYTDLAQSHGLVLFRGELTSSPGGQGTVLSPDDAQRLALLLQQFYLPPRGNDERGAMRAKLLQRFHEKPEAFRWQDVIDSVVL